MLGKWLVATLIGTALQVAMVTAGHYLPAVQSLFAPLGMAISGLAGWLAVRRAGGAASPPSWPLALAAGAAAGGLCASLGIGLSWQLGDVPAALLTLGTASSLVTGLIGGAVARVGK